MVTEVFKGRSGSPLHLQAIGPVVVARLRQTDSARRVLAQASVFPPPVEVSLLIDTGASISFIQRHIPLVLGLRPMREEDVRTADHKVVRCPVYLATLELPLETHTGPSRMAPFELALAALPDAPHDPGYVGLLGRDFLANFAFFYDGTDGRFELHLPSR